jgi:phosphatidylserine/phosphatidylglycerophosphate/cardiolipin synthase-like enzyme
LIRAHKRGVKIRVLMDNLQAKSKYAEDEALAAAGVPARVDKSSAAMHHKFMVGDSKAILTGSFNWTKNAVERNAENFVIVRMKYIIRPFEREFDRIWEDAAP